MSTRATYQINKTTFYCHYDGYPTGAAQRFASMVAAMTVAVEGHRIIDERRGGFEYAFIRGVMDAEPTKNHDEHGDTEWRYTLNVAKDGSAAITVHEGKWKDQQDGGSWRTFSVAYHGDLAAWLNEQRGELVKMLTNAKAKGYSDIKDPEAEALECIPVMVRVEEPFDYGTGHAVYATATEATKIAKMLQAQSDGFSPDNPNRNGYAKRTAAWRAAVEPELQPA